jgi:hypothetical protein
MHQDDLNSPSSLDSPSHAEGQKIDTDGSQKQISALFNDIVSDRTGQDDGGNSYSKKDHDDANYDESRNRSNDEPIFVPQLKRKLF